MHFAKNGQENNLIQCHAMGFIRSGRKNKLIDDDVVKGKVTIVNEFDKDLMLMNYDAWRDDALRNVCPILNSNTEKSRFERIASCKTFSRNDKDFNIDLTVTVGDESYSGYDAEIELTKIFPKELERFFFIDGEEVEAHTAMMKSSLQGLGTDIKSILGIPSLTRGIYDIKSVKGIYDAAISQETQNEKRNAKNLE